jgi:hypothetical protein
MGVNVVISLDQDQVDRYARAAAGNGRSLEEELRAALDVNPDGYVKNAAKLLRLSDEALAMTPPEGPDGRSDSTLLIRWDRDTQHGKWVDDGWADHDAGR